MTADIILKDTNMAAVKVYPSAPSVNKKLSDMMTYSSPEMLDVIIIPLTTLTESNTELIDDDEKDTNW